MNSVKTGLGLMAKSFSFNHAAIKRQAKDEIDGMSDTEFLMSEQNLHYNRTFLASITDTDSCCPYELVLRKGRPDETAYTEGTKVVVNVCNSIFAGLTRFVKFIGIHFHVAHESGHLLYTDFVLFRKAMESYTGKNELHPKPVDASLYERFRGSVGNSGWAISLYRNFFNIAEDGNIEKQVQNKFMGLIPEFRLVNGLYLKESPSLDGMTDPTQVILAASMQRAVYHEGKGTADPKFSPILDKILPMIDEIVAEDNPYRRYRLINDTFCEIALYLSDYYAANKDSSSGTGESVEQAIKDALGSVGAGQNSLENGPRTHASNYMGSSNMSVKTMLGGSKEESPADGSGSNMSNAGSDMSDTGSGSSSSASAANGSPNGSNGSGKKGGASSKGAGKGVDTSSVSSAAFNQVSGNVLEEAETKAEEKVLSDIARNDASTVKRDLKGDARCLHDEVHAEFVRNKPDADQYITCLNAVSPIVSRMEREINRAFADIEIGEERSGLYWGDRFDASSAYRLDGACFASEDGRKDRPELAVFVLVDKSGSMVGPKMEEARNAALAVYLLCQKTGLPVSVYAHNERGDVNLISCAEFFSHDKKDAQRIAGLKAGGSNRDGFAIRFAAKRLLSCGSKNSLLLIISDGRPSASGYFGPAADRDTRDAVTEAIKKGISVITVAIGDCANDIRHVYRSPENGERQKLARVLEVDDLTQLPKKFAGLVKDALELD